MTSPGTARKTLLARMRARVDACPERVAVRTPEASVTYRDFSRLVGWLGHELRCPERAPRGPVGLLLDRSAAAYAAMWAAIAAGRPYVPLNPRHPPERLRNIVGQAGIETAICTAAERDLPARLGIAPGNAIVAETQLPAAEASGGGRSTGAFPTVTRERPISSSRRARRASRRACRFPTTIFTGSSRIWA